MLTSPRGAEGIVLYELDSILAGDSIGIYVIKHFTYD